jgi:hypothetical protein
VYKWISSLLAIACWGFLGSGCDESLPPRSDPVNILQPSLIPPHEIIEMKDGVPIREAGAIIVSLKNIYTEVLQKEADVEVLVNVWMATSSEVHRTIRLTALHMGHPAMQGNLLTLLPQDSARFVALWDQRTDEGVPFWQYVHVTTKTGINDQTYQDSDPIEFVVQVSIRLFKNVQPRVSPPIHYTSTYRLFTSTTDGNN